jgi:hypothetical protein
LTKWVQRVEPMAASLHCFQAMWRQNHHGGRAWWKRERERERVRSYKGTPPVAFLRLGHTPNNPFSNELTNESIH